MMQVKDFLGEGRNRAISARELCQITGMDRRTISWEIARERKSGIPICAATEMPAGYYLAANAEEMKSYCSALKRREKEIKAVRLACEKTITELENS